jgi:ubiquinone/menaquinone biosynthesis C-methylase UbiE
MTHGIQGRTRSHYDEFPFDFLTEEDERHIERLQPAPFRKFADAYLGPGTVAAEIGCGPGRATLFMARRGVDLLAVDISGGTLALARRRAPGCKFVQATNLQLPLRDATFQVVVSDGVIHHTPDAHASFRENARILREGGLMYVSVYRRRRYYYYVYTYAGPPLRWLEKRAWGRALVQSTALPLYYLAHLAKSRGRRTWRGARNFFYDYIITPRATFHTREEVEGWGRATGLELVDYEEKVGNTHAFVFRKAPSGASRA